MAGVSKLDKTLMDEISAALLRKDANLAAQVLSEFLEVGNHAEFLQVLREMTNVFGGMSTLAKHVGHDSIQIDCQLSCDGDPLISSLLAILKGMGMELRVRALPKGQGLPSP